MSILTAQISSRTLILFIKTWNFILTTFGKHIFSWIAILITFLNAWALSVWFVDAVNSNNLQWLEESCLSIARMLASVRKLIDLFAYIESSSTTAIENIAKISALDDATRTSLISLVFQSKELVLGLLAIYIYAKIVLWVASKCRSKSDRSQSIFESASGSIHEVPWLEYLDRSDHDSYKTFIPYIYPSLFCFWNGVGRFWSWLRAQDNQDRGFDRPHVLPADEGAHGSNSQLSTVQNEIDSPYELDGTCLICQRYHCIHENLRRGEQTVVDQATAVSTAHADDESNSNTPDEHRDHGFREREREQDHESVNGTKIENREESRDSKSEICANAVVTTSGSRRICLSAGNRSRTGAQGRVRSKSNIQDNIQFSTEDSARGEKEAFHYYPSAARGRRNAWDWTNIPSPLGPYTRLPPASSSSTFITQPHRKRMLNRVGEFLTRVILAPLRRPFHGQHPPSFAGTTPQTLDPSRASSRIQLSSLHDMVNHNFGFVAGHHQPRTRQPIRTGAARSRLFNPNDQAVSLSKGPGIHNNISASPRRPPSQSLLMQRFLRDIESPSPLSGPPTIRSSSSAALGPRSRNQYPPPSSLSRMGSGVRRDRNRRVRFDLDPLSDPTPPEDELEILPSRSCRTGNDLAWSTRSYNDRLTSWLRDRRTRTGPSRSSRRSRPPSSISAQGATAADNGGGLGRRPAIE